jgi:uncharacterized protein
MAGSAGAGWLNPRADGVRLSIRVTPRSARSGVQGIEQGADGQPYLAVRVQAAPEGGKANAEAIKLLARRWGVAAHDLRLVSGGGSRRKVLELAGPADQLAARLRAIEEAGETPSG